MIALDATQWAALWYVGGMISGALVMIAFLNSQGEQLYTNILTAWSMPYRPGKSRTKHT